MEMNEIRDHWDSLAKKHGSDLKSTTKTPTIKQLEISALARAISKTKDAAHTRNILEVGCGNGHNIFALSLLFPDYSFHGLDYSEEMIKLANKIRIESPSRNVKFDVANVLELANNNALEKEYNLVFTDRLLINLNSWKTQQQGLLQLLSRVKKGGYLLIIENFIDAYGNQNYLRELLGLQARTPDPYNKFIDEAKLESFACDELNLKLLLIENFGSLHDLILYVLLPHINSGEVIYNHPLMESVTSLLEKLPEEIVNGFGNFGQNKLYLFEKV
jgi:SAM-dependent methyltransferase